MKRKIKKKKSVFGDVKEFTISRKRWLRPLDGKDFEESLLYSGKSKKMCCLGFYARSCGLPVDDIKNISLPTSVFDEPRTFDESFIVSDNKKWNTFLKEKIINYHSTCNESLFVHINDDESIKAKDRERLLKKEFAKFGVKVKFVP